jgi:excisionase family DNA binding protein
MDSRVSEHEFLRPDEVARLLRCGRTKAYELLRTGEVPSYRVGRSRTSLDDRCSSVTLDMCGL